MRLRQHYHNAQHVVFVWCMLLVVVPGPIASPESCLEMQIPKALPRPTEQKPWGWCPAICVDPLLIGSFERIKILYLLVSAEKILLCEISYGYLGVVQCFFNDLGI